MSAEVGPGRPVILLVVGSRGPGLAETLASVGTRGEVVVAATTEVLAARRDASQLADVVMITADDGAALVDRVAAEQTTLRVAGVVTVADDTVVLAARIAARLGLRGLDPQQVHVFRDKTAQRRCLAAAGLTVPAYAESTLGGDRSAVAAIPLPAVVKPTRGSGGALAFVVTDHDQLDHVLDECDARTSGATAVDDDTAFIVEQVIVGSRWHPTDGFAPYVSVETAALDGLRWHLAVTDRFPLLPPVLETGMCLPSALSADQQDEVVAVTEKALAALGFDQGISHTELMLTADGPVVIEVNARTGGALPYLFPTAGGPDLTAMAADLALGVPPSAVAFTGHAVFVALQHPLGVEVTGLSGLDEIAALPGVRAVIPLSGVGHSTRSLQDTLAALVLGHVVDPVAAVDLQQACYAAFRGTYAGGPTPAHYRRTPDGVVHPPV
jgi:biotin carboxylase